MAASSPESPFTGKFDLPDEEGYADHDEMLAAIYGRAYQSGSFVTELTYRGWSGTQVFVGTNHNIQKKDPKQSV